MEIKTKICASCRIEKSINDFHKRRGSADGVTSYCKECRSDRRRVLYPIKECLACGNEFRPKMKDSLTCSSRCSDRASKNKRREELKLYQKNYDKKYYFENKEAKLEYQKEYAKTHAEKVSNYHKEYRDKNAEKLKIKHREYSKRNRERRNIYEAKRKEENPQLRILHNLRNRLYKILKGENRSISTMKLLGCSMKELKIHFNELFTDSMTWDNYGRKWHVDHVLPCDSFDLRNSEEQELCFHYTNLQPLLIKDNIEKSNNIDYLGG